MTLVTMVNHRDHHMNAQHHHQHHNHHHNQLLSSQKLVGHHHHHHQKCEGCAPVPAAQQQQRTPQEVGAQLLQPEMAQRPARQHKNSTASSITDQYSSLNLSSVASSASSASSSVAHSPLLLAESPSSPAPLSPLELAINATTTSGSSGRSTEESKQNICDPRRPQEDADDDAITKLRPQAPTNPQRLSISISNNNNNNNNTIIMNHQLMPQHQKVRSLSHSNTYCPLLVSPAHQNHHQAGKQLSTSLITNPCNSSTASSPSTSSGRHSAASSCQENAADNQQPQQQQQDQQDQQDQQPISNIDLPIVTRPRRLSRIEHRQSLLELGYGKIESYFKLQRLGKGTYATVYMGRSRLSNDLVALKEILKEHDEGAPCTAIREVSLLRLLRHKNIVTLHDICHTPNKLTLVFEYVGPDLYAYMKENNNLLSIHNVRLLLYQLLRGISFCHSRQVLHRDLKPQNLLINSRGELKICDFGLARAKSIPTKSYSNEVVTLWYRPPDVLLGNTDYDHSIDMWGVGCIFYEMASGRTFFPGSNVRQQLYLIFSSLGAPNRHNWPEILQNPEYQSYSFPSFRPEKLAHRVPRLDSNGIVLLMSFLRFKPSERISADEARRDPFFASLPDQVHHLSERESIFEVPGVYMTLNPGKKLNHHHI